MAAAAAASGGMMVPPVMPMGGPPMVPQVCVSRVTHRCVFQSSQPLPLYGAAHMHIHRDTHKHACTHTQTQGPYSAPSYPMGYGPPNPMMVSGPMHPGRNDKR